MVETAASILKAKKAQQVWFVVPDATVFDAITLMAEKNVGAVLVMAEGKPCGILSERDYARKIILEGRSSRTTRVEEIMTRTLITVTPESTLDECMKVMTKNRIRHLPVLSKGKLVGLVSIGDLVNAVIAEQAYKIDQLESYISHG